MIQPQFRRARRADLPAIVAMLADDSLGQSREDARLIAFDLQRCKRQVEMLLG